MPSEMHLVLANAGLMRDEQDVLDAQVPLQSRLRYDSHLNC